MKKILVFVMAIIMSLTVSITAFAAPNGFAISPGANIAPELVEYDKESLDCLATLIITAYADRASLPADIRADLEKAYNDIVTANNLSDICAELVSVAQTLGIETKNLAVSELFDVSYFNCDDHDGHGGFSLKIKSQSLQGFVGLLHKNGDAWELVKNATLDPDGIHLSFTVDSLSPFAIVVETDDGSEKPPHSGDSFPFAAVFAFVAASALTVVLVVGAKKKKA